MNDLSVEDKRIFDRMPQTDRVKAAAAGVKAKFLQVQAGIKTIDQVAEEEGREKEELREMAIRDGLTGAWSKVHMNSILNHEIRSRERKTSGLGLFFVDVDHFKNVNDEEPDKHEAGDRTLTALRKILEKVCGDEADVGRWGGEEWVVLYAGAQPPDLFRLGQDMGRTVAQNLAKAANLARPTVTVSIGAVMFQPGESVRDIVGRADQAMYQAKQLGRNRMVVAGEKQEVVEFGS